MRLYASFRVVGGGGGGPARRPWASLRLGVGRPLPASRSSCWVRSVSASTVVSAGSRRPGRRSFTSQKSTCVTKQHREVAFGAVECDPAGKGHRLGGVAPLQKCRSGHPRIWEDTTC